MINLKPEEYKYVRYLWINQEDLYVENPRIEEYEMTVLLFGLRCSTFVLASVLQEHLEKFKNQFPDTVNIMKNNFYVDDIITCLPCKNSSIRFINESYQIMQEAGMQLCKFQSNLAEIDKNEITEAHDKVEHLWSKGSAVFGVRWNQINDNFEFNINSLLNKDIWSVRSTKRNLLSLVSSIWDPLGLIGAFTIKIKMGMQELWKRGLKWDEPLPEDQIKKWKSIWDELKYLNDLRVPSWYEQEIVGTERERELRILTDAAEKKAYGSVAYLRSIADNVVV